MKFLSKNRITGCFLLHFTFTGCIALSGTSADKKSTSAINCHDYDWGKVEQMVQPHLDEFMFTSFVMQGQSSNYKTSEAAYHALSMDGGALPDEIKTTLNYLIRADC